MYASQSGGRRPDGAYFNSALATLDASWPCFWGKRVIGSAGVTDGNKWLCGFGSLSVVGKTCTVYSFGSSDDTTFEQAVLRLNPNCAVRIFDPTTYGPDYDPSVLFVKEGLHGREDDHVLPGIGRVRSLRQHMERMGDDHIDILKIDIEKSEWSVLEQWQRDRMPSVGQLAIEVHLDARKAVGQVSSLITAMEGFGFRLAHREFNLVEPGACAELLFVQRWWHPEVRRYPMDDARPPQSAMTPHVGELQGVHCNDFSRTDATLHATMVRAADVARHAFVAAPPPNAIAAVEPNYPCLLGTHEFAAETPVCGLREADQCNVHLVNAKWYGRHLEKALLAINAGCKFKLLQVQPAGAKNYRQDGRCGPLKLLPDRSAPARCRLEQYPCCSQGGWCGVTRSHCECGTCVDFRKYEEPAGLSWHFVGKDRQLPSLYEAGEPELTLLQVNVAGWEWEVVQLLTSGAIKAWQVVLIFHLDGSPNRNKHSKPSALEKRFADAVASMDKAGFRLLHRRFSERNLGGVPGDCPEGCLEAGFVRSGIF